MNLDKLKESARRFEQKEDWRRAIEVYERALSELETQGDPVPDPSVYNRVGDLHLKVGDTPSAVRSYERALELYADQGFLNNAIALGGKILRVDGTRTATHLRLARLHAHKNVVPEVRRHLGEYLQRMQRDHQLAAAVTAIRSFARQDCRNADMRREVADLVGQVTPNGADGHTLGDLLEEIRGLDAEESGSARSGSSDRGGGLIFLDTGAHDASDPAQSGVATEVEPVEGLNTIEATLPAAVEGLPVIGLEFSEFAAPEELVVEQVGGIELEDSSFGPGASAVDLDERPADPMAGVGLAAEPLDGLTPTVVEVEPIEPGVLDGLEIEVFDAMDADDLLGEAPAMPGGLELISLDGDLPIEPIPLDAPTAAPAARPEPAEPRPGSLEELEGRLAAYEAAEDWAAALDTAAELVRRDPDAIPRYQKQVELAYRAGDRAVLTARYLELGDALLRAGMRAPAVAVYQRVLDHEPGDRRALGALASLGVPVAPLEGHAGQAQADARADYVDLGALILGEAPTRDSRMRVDAGEPEEPEDEDETFREILEQFKRGIEENLDAEDFQAHYDLGIAFKEMGLLDEAIAQFQRALRSPEGRLRASEALGVAFHDKGRHAIAEAVLTRAIEGIPGADDEKIGLIYWLGRSLEAQGRDPEALAWYERALAVDIRFLDLGERLSRLSQGRPA